jgi:hypothetical protein
MTTTLETEPRPEWADSCCGVCPAQKLPVGQFDVIAAPGSGYQYDPALDVRVDVVTKKPTCVHPFRVGLPPGLYLSAGTEVPAPGAERPARPVREPGRRPRTRSAVFTPTPEQLVLPEQLDDLEGWLIAMLRTARPNEMDSALKQAESIASERFSSGDIIAALRRVLSSELAG